MIIRKRTFGKQTVFELRDNIENCPRCSGDSIIEDAKLIDKFYYLVGKAVPSRVYGLSTHPEYDVNKRLSDGGLSIYTNNPNLIWEI